MKTVVIVLLTILLTVLSINGVVNKEDDNEHNNLQLVREIIRLEKEREEAILHNMWLLEAFNLVNIEGIKSHVQVHNERMNPSGNNSITASGTIIYRDETKSIILTNTHVVRLDDYETQIFSVENYEGSTFEAEIYNDYIDASKDLALLVVYSDTVGEVLTLASIDEALPKILFTMAELSQSRNTVLIGTPIGFSDVNVHPDLGDYDLDFQALTHDTPLRGGASGGAVVRVNVSDDNNAYSVALYGVTFGYSLSRQEALAVPLDVVTDFLRNANLLP